MKPRNEILTFLFALATFAVGIVLVPCGCRGQGWIRDFTVFPPPTIPKISSSWQLQFDILRVMDPEKNLSLTSIVMDPHYILPSYATAMKLIAAASKKVDRRYVQHAWDCEDVSLQFVCEIRRLAKVESREFPSGFPAAMVGAMVYGPIPEFKWPFSEFPFGHAMVAVRIDDGRWLLVEPQNGRVVDITSPIYEGLLDVRVVIL